MERAALEEYEMEYLYDDGEYYYFMDTENYEQTHLSKELLGDAVDYLIPQLHVNVEFYEGKTMSVELPHPIGSSLVGEGLPVPAASFAPRYIVRGVLRQVSIP